MKYILTSLIFVSIIALGQSRRPVILRMTDYNSETNESRYYAAEKMMNQVGIPYDTTSSLSSALSHPVIILGSRIADNGLSTSQLLDIENYVTNGGVLIQSNLREPDFYAFSGISAMTSSDTLYTIDFDTTIFPQYYELISDSMEVQISIGRKSDSSSIVIKDMTPSTGTTLAYYNSGGAALIKQDNGSGTVYSFGIDFRDLSYRNMLDLDANAHRYYSNGFEPTTDVMVMLLRNIIRDKIPTTVWKHTLPLDYEHVVMITHDIDSRTGIDSMHFFSTYQQSNGIPALYNITTRYTSDSWMTNFYIGATAEINQLLFEGHTIASHSVGHFPDFADDAVFPYGSLGNTSGTYTPTYNAGVTSGGTVIGELEVSKNLLDDDFGVTVRSFRAGHLAYPNKLINGLEESGYSFNSTFSAGNVLTSLPYFGHYDRSFSGAKSTVLEMPMTISDVFSSDPITSSNYPTKVQTWNEVTDLYRDNYCPVILLIHPNRQYKLQAMDDYLNDLKPNTEFMIMDEYGDYWLERDSIDFTSSINIDTLEVSFTTEVSYLQSIAIDDSNVDSVRLFDKYGSVLTYSRISLSPTKGLYYDFGTNPNGIEEQMVSTNVWPNPTKGKISFKSSQQIERLQIFSVEGQLLKEFWPNSISIEVDFASFAPSNGIYLALISTEKGTTSKKVVFNK